MIHIALDNFMVFVFYEYFNVSSIVDIDVDSDVNININTNFTYSILS